MVGKKSYQWNMHRRAQVSAGDLSNSYYSSSPSPAAPSTSPTGFSVLIVTAAGSPTAQPMNSQGTKKDVSTTAPTKKPIATKAPTQKPVKTQAPATRPPTNVPTTKTLQSAPTSESMTVSPTDFFNAKTSNGPTVASQKRAGNGTTTTTNRNIASNSSLFWIFCLAALSMLVVLSIGLLIVQMKKRRRQTPEQNPQENSSPPPFIITCTSDDKSEEVTITMHDENIYNANVTNGLNDEYSIDEFTFQNTEKGDDDHQSIAFSMDAQSCM